MPYVFTINVNSHQVTLNTISSVHRLSFMVFGVTYTICEASKLDA